MKEKVGREEGDEGTGMERKPGRAWDELWELRDLGWLKIPLFIFFPSFFFLGSDLMDKRVVRFSGGGNQENELDVDDYQGRAHEMERHDS